VNQTQIKIIQETVGTEPDGFFGPRSIVAVQRHLRMLMPKSHPWPMTDQQSLTEFYGPPGGVGSSWDLVQIPVPYKMYLYNGPQTVRTIGVHEKLATSLERVLKELGKRYKTDEDRTVAGINRFYGVYNNRKMRGGSLPSLHARAAAIDFDMPRNGLHTAWPTRAHMPLDVMECFAYEGWLPAGAFWGRDAMHFQATA
jgi:hypothetical protein